MRTVRTLMIAVVIALAMPDRAGLAQQHSRRFPPKDLALLEPPDRDVWQRPEQIMDAMGIAEGSVVADLGAGGGWFTVRLARRVGPNGRVYAEDVQPEMINSIKRRTTLEGLNNVETRLGTDTDPRLPRNALDAVLIVDSFHEVEKPVLLLRNLALSLKPDGRIGIVDFTKDGGGPGGAIEERIDPESVVRSAEGAGLQLLKRETFLRYQYMLVFGKRRP